MNQLKNIYNKWGYNLPLLIAFFLPFGINHGIIIITWSILFVLTGDIKKKIVNLFSNKWAYLLIGFFLIHAIGYFFSQNKYAAINAIEIKLGFLAFPILIFASNYSNIELKKIIIAFVSGNILGAIFCIFRSLYLYLFEHTNAFFYSEFSYFMHPSYFAMYLIFAQLIVMLYYPKWLSHLSNLNVKLGFMSLVLLVTIFLCSSKMGLITAFILLPATFATQLYKTGHKKLIIYLIALFIIGISVAYKLFPTPFERLKYAFRVTESVSTIDKTDGESTAVRILIWEEAIKIVKQNIWLGTTAGDANDMLVMAYEKEGMTGALLKKLNAHNQFLQTFIGTGVVGFLLLILMTFGLIIYGTFTKNKLLILFGILTSCNFLVESMLQAQAGFIFFSFFLCLLLQYNLFNFSITQPETKEL